MSKLIIDENQDFAEEVRKASLNFNGQYGLNGKPLKPIEILRKTVREYFRNNGYLYYLLFFLVLLVFGELYANTRLSFLLSEQTDRLWQTISISTN